MPSKTVVALSIALTLSAQTWQTARPGYRYEFPRDHFSHPDYQTEWWYYTGNLRAADGHRYGFEMTFFRQGSDLPQTAAVSKDAVWRPDQLYLAHLALSDIDGKSFYHAERLNRAGPGLAGDALTDRRYWNGNWQVRWLSFSSENQELRAVCDRFSLRLRLQSAKPPVIEGVNGVSRKGSAPGAASHYLSFTRLSANGQLERDNAAAIALSGVAWMDHEFFTEPPDANLSGWDWFAIQLNTGEELMLYRLRDKAGQPTPYSSGVYVDRQGHSKYLPAAAFSLRPGGEWRSPNSGARYPLSWRIAVPSLNLDLAAQTPLNDQELWKADGLSPGYWEGAVTYQGNKGGQRIDGVGYLEMTGYAQPINLSGMTQK